MVSCSHHKSEPFSTVAVADHTELGAGPKGAGLTMGEAHHAGLGPCRGEGGEECAQPERLVVRMGDDGDDRPKAGKVVEEIGRSAHGAR